MMRGMLTLAFGWVTAWSNPAYAEVTTESHVWAHAAVQSNVTDRVSAAVSQHWRTGLNGDDFQQIIPAVGIEFDAHPHISFGLGGRYSIEHESDNDTTRTPRFHGEAQTSTPSLGPLQLRYRLRAQRSTSNTDADPAVRLRNRGTVRLATGSAIRPELFYEHFLDPFGDANRKSQKQRMGGGAGVKLTPHHRVKIKLFQETELDGDGDKVRVASLAYRYRF